jgi:hypothetical protein
MHPDHSIAEIAPLLSAIAARGVRHIRPYQLFAHLGSDRDVHYRIPSESGVISGTVSSLDTLCLIAAVRIAKPKTLLEFGTGLGYNAYHLCWNTDISITTIDKDERPAAYLPHFADRVERVTSDVMAFQPSHSYDMTFCDVNIPGVTERCTEIAFSVNPKVMAWHDYGHPLCPHVKPYLDSLDLPLVHIEDSLMVFWFRDGSV